jgi:hypothetical protein
MADQAPSVVDAELRADTLGLPDAEQLELIRDQVPSRDAGTAVAIQRRGGRGRRPGSLNRRNADFRAYILSQHMHPGLALARTYDRPVELLAAELNCTLVEAATLQARAAAELLPYVESKMPVLAKIERRGDVVLIMPGQGMAEEAIDAIARDVTERSAEGIDWGSAEIAELPPSLLGEPVQDVSREPGD